MNALLMYFSMYAPLNPVCCDCILDLIKRRIISRKELLFHKGQVCEQFCFVEVGLLRSCYMQGNKEITSRFMQKGDCCSLPESFFYQVPARQNVQALEDCYLHYIDYWDLQGLYREFPALNACARLWLQEDRVLNDRKIEAMWTWQARDRYAWFTEKFPDMVNKVPGKYLASYLGISEVKMSQLAQERKALNR